MLIIYGSRSFFCTDFRLHIPFSFFLSSVFLCISYFLSFSFALFHVITEVLSSFKTDLFHIRIRGLITDPDPNVHLIPYPTGSGSITLLSCRHSVLLLAHCYDPVCPICLFLTIINQLKIVLSSENYGWSKVISVFL
jgi:hypothetical protein